MTRGQKTGLLVALKVVIAAIYVNGVRHGSIQPTLSAWAIGFVSVTLVAFFYFKENGFEWANLGNNTDTVFVWCMFPVVLIWGQGAYLHWKPFDLICGALALGIMIYWLKWRKHKNASLLMQVVMCLSLVTLWNNLLGANENPESYAYWGIILVSEIVGLDIAVEGKSFLAKVYARRAITIVSITIVLMLRITFLKWLG